MWGAGQPHDGRELFTVVTSLGDGHQCCRGESLPPVAQAVPSHRNCVRTNVGDRWASLLAIGGRKLLSECESHRRDIAPPPRWLGPACVGPCGPRGGGPGSPAVGSGSQPRSPRQGPCQAQPGRRCGGEGACAEQCHASAPRLCSTPLLHALAAVSHTRTLTRTFSDLQDVLASHSSGLSAQRLLSVLVLLSCVLLHCILGDGDATGRPAVHSGETMASLALPA